MVDAKMATVDNLPIQLAIRLVLDDVSYSNPVPSWFDPITINYQAREIAIQQKIQRYTTVAPVMSPFRISVPKRSGQKRVWSVPSVNDQIVLQACISSFAEELDHDAIGPNVFSYRYNLDDNLLALVEDQLAAWTRFQDETKRRCQSSQCLLQIDLQNAFRSIDRPRFYTFLAHYAKPEALTVIRLLTDSCSDGPGLPLVNNSVFFLGNAYLSTVDNIVSRHGVEFLRFVDDYRIFGSSKKELERVLRSIRLDLERSGYQLNPEKLRVGSGQEYLESITKLKYKPDDSDEEYVQAPFVRAAMSHDAIVSTVSMVVNDPERYLNEGFGRFVLAGIRRSRFNRSVAFVRHPELEVMEEASDADQSGNEGKTLTSLLSENTDLLRAMTLVLEKYSAKPDELWRTVWLLYVSKLVDLESVDDAEVKVKFQNSLRRASTRGGLVAQLWNSSNAGVLLRDRDIETLHDLGYLECGERYCGR